MAKYKATGRRQQLLVEFYVNYVQKLAAAQMGNKEAFDKYNEQIARMVNRSNEPDLPGIVYHSIAKEMYKIALNTLGSKYKRMKNDLMAQAASMFETAVEHDHKESLFYLGEMCEKGDMEGGTNYKQATDYYKAAAAFDNPKALFKLSQL